MSEEFGALRASKSPLEFWRNDKVKCPHCGTDHDPYANEWFHLYEEDSHSCECPICERHFVVSTHATYTFSTDEQA